MLDLKRFLDDFFTITPAPKSEWERVYRSMIVHTRGVKPRELLEIKRPNEPKDVRDYRLANYRPITKHGINQAIDSVYRVLSNSNYSIVYSDNISEYLTETSFEFLGEHKDFEQVFFQSLLRLIFDDPNGMLVWMPENTNQELTPFEQDTTEPINVKPVYVCSTDIMHVSKDVGAWKGGKLAVLVPAGHNNTKEELHDYYFIATKDFIYRYVPYYNGEKKQVQYRIEDWYNLSLTDGEPDSAKKFPSNIWHVLGGNIAMTEIIDEKKRTKELVRYYDSFYGCYVPFGDECICAFSDNSAVRVRYNFPFTAVKGEKCVTCKGVGKVSDEGGKRTCNTCQGSGKIIPFTPFGHFLKEPPATNDSEAFTSSPAIEFYSPDVAILKESYETWEDFLLKAKETVNLIFIDESQSGVAKEIDREQKYETLIKIKQNFFGLMRWSLEIIEAYKVPFVADRQDNQVIEPESFAIKSEQQLMSELNEMSQKETPQAFISTTSKQIADKIYSDNPEAKIIIEILSKWDVLFGKNSSAVSQLKSVGAVNDIDVIRHAHGFAVLSRLAMQNDFTKMKFSEIIDKADSEIEKLLPQTELVMP